MGKVWDDATPFREKRGVELVPVESPPPTPLVQVDSGVLVVDSSTRRIAWITCCLWLLGLALGGWGFGWGWSLGTILVALGTMPFALRHLRREHLVLRDGALWYRASFGRWQRTPIHSIRAIEVEAEESNHHRLRIQRDGGMQLLVGNGHGHDKETMIWIQRWLEERITAALATDAPALPSAQGS